MPDKVYQGLPFEEAIAYFRGKVKVPTKRWNDLWQGMHARGFMVAGAMQGDVLTGFYEALDKAISKGTTLAEFQKDFDNIVAKTGWSYNGERGWRSRTIYENNLFTAYQAGRYAQMTDEHVLKARPYWTYHHGDSLHPRAEHLRWHGLSLRAYDPWWQTHYPRNGWGCTCTVFAESKEDLAAQGKTGPDEAPAMHPYQWTDKKTGQAYTVADKGIDPGWDYNVGEAAWGRSKALRLMDDTGPWTDLYARGPSDYGRPEKLVPAPSATRPGKQAHDEASLRALLREAIGGDVAYYTDPTKTVLEVNQGICDHIMKKPETRLDGREGWFSFIPELIEDPYEIWVGFAKSELSGRVSIRRRYVKAIKAGDKKVIGLWADFVDGQWASGDFFRGGLTGAGNLRKGRMVYGKD